MKSKAGVLIGLGLMVASAAYSQVEVDDMYFNSKDRAKLASSKPVSLTTVPQADNAWQGTQTITPTDSYSGRGENPDYTGSESGDVPYFNSNYQPTGVNQSLSNTYSGYGSPSYCNSCNGYGMNSMYGNPYNSFYSPYSSMGGYGMGMGYGMGSPYGMMNYGYGMGMGSYSMLSFGFGSGYGYGSPYSSFGYGMGMGYGMGYPYYGYGSPVYIVNDGNSGVAYGKRSSRSNSLNNNVGYSRPTNAGASGIGTTPTRSVSNGRVGGGGESQYYQRGWRANTTPSGTGTTSGRSWSNPNSSGSRSSSWGNANSSPNWGGSNNNSNSRSSFGSGGGSSGFSGGGVSGGGGHSGGGGGRGRH